MASDYVTKLRASEGQLGVAKEVDAMLNALSARDPRTNASLIADGSAHPGGMMYRSGAPDGSAGAPEPAERPIAERIGDAVARMLRGAVQPPPVTTPASPDAGSPPPAATANGEPGSTLLSGRVLAPEAEEMPQALRDLGFRGPVVPASRPMPELVERPIPQQVEELVRTLEPARRSPAMGEVRIAPEGSPLSSPPIDPTREQAVALADSIRSMLTGAFAPTPPRDVPPIDVSKPEMARREPPAQVGQSGVQIPVVEEDRTPARAEPQIVDHSVAPQAMQGISRPGAIMAAVLDVLGTEGEKRMLPELVSYARERAAMPTSSLVEEAMRRRGGR